MIKQEDISRVNVFLWGKNIGQLSWNKEKNLSTFQLSNAFREFGFPISPISHQRNNPELATVYGEKGDRYQGLPPFLSDSLPDDWGNRLFDRWLSETKMESVAVNPLYRLSFIGKRGMGAFEYVPELDINPGSEPSPVDVAELYRISLDVLHDRESRVLSAQEKSTLEKLIQLGTSAGGKHAKGLIAISDATGEIRSGQIDLPEDFRYYIIKFKEDADVPTAEIEMVYNRMAVDCGIDMMPCRIFTVEGTNHFLTERFDRRGGEKLLTQTLSAVAPRAMDYTNLFRLCDTLGLAPGTKEQLFTRMAFNFVAGVTDDHNKNFSFIMDRKGAWSLSPAYDVMFTANIWKDPSADIHSLGVSGKRVHVTLEDLRQFGEDFEVRGVEDILKRVCAAVDKFPVLCAEFGVGDEWKERITAALDHVFPERKAFANARSITRKETGILNSIGIAPENIKLLQNGSTVHVDSIFYRPKQEYDKQEPGKISVNFILVPTKNGLLFRHGNISMPLTKAARAGKLYSGKQKAAGTPEKKTKNEKRSVPKKK